MIENEKISLRGVEMEDADLLYQWENDRNLWSVSNTLAPFSRHQIEQYVLMAQNNIYEVGQLRLMIDVVSEKQPFETIGMIDLFEFDALHQRAGLGIMIHEKWRDKGMATSALNLLCNYAFHTLGLHQIYCNISETNAASLHLFTKSGFELIGVKKDWVRTKDGFVNELMLQKIDPKERSDFRKWEL